MMVFVDGENLVLRYEAMQRQGRTCKDDVAHEPGVFVWKGETVEPGLNVVLRATYYTYATGSDRQLRQIRERIKQLHFRQYRPPPPVVLRGMLLKTMYPRVFKKVKGKQAKGVDIQMTVDILSHVYQGNLDVVYLVSGDGDYFPVIEESIRMGKQVYVAALSDGLNPLLVSRADRFIDLDRVYFG